MAQLGPTLDYGQQRAMAGCWDEDDASLSGSIGTLIGVDHHVLGNLVYEPSFALSDDRGQFFPG